MKRKTSITRSEDVLTTLGRVARKGESRSRTIERILREGLLARARRTADEKDLALINKHADRLNREAGDALGYQAGL